MTQESDDYDATRQTLFTHLQRELVREVAVVNTRFADLSRSVLFTADTLGPLIQQMRSAIESVQWIGSLLPQPKEK